jgi:hypothetical protein
MAIATVLTDRFDRTFLYSTHVHRGQVRKGTSTPYVAHLLAIAATVLEYGGDENHLAIAALLQGQRRGSGWQWKMSGIDLVSAWPELSRPALIASLTLR